MISLNENQYSKLFENPIFSLFGDMWGGNKNGIEGVSRNTVPLKKEMAENESDGS